MSEDADKKQLDDWAASLPKQIILRGKGCRDIVLMPTKDGVPGGYSAQLVRAMGDPHLVEILDDQLGILQQLALQQNESVFTLVRVAIADYLAKREVK